MPSDEPETQGAHLELLSLIEQHPEYSQRRLAQAMGISLGKAHYLLKALFDKGLVKAGNFRRSDSKLSYLYALTPAGVRHRMQLTQSFLRRKEQEFELLRAEIDRLRTALGQQAAGSRSPDTVS
ncbi:MarR family EPS-associated transcriptional regulator [Ideonella azotifigens]|uniref:MarR family EPS-associated transcriptional regulator n=1 Tax=Ideonella azotifigens TaxID=513160 RepID=UPI001E47282C|nr:MarR family EPS-associated transcriptional regulator [Ideonella azotifigens]MCD2341574.1 MarR family EPS-associated transcriptional regulator [Ideonella azotifigens]